MRTFLVVAAAVFLAACDRSKPELEKALAQSQQISAEKDSLLRDVVATSQFISQVNDELAAVKGSKDKPMMRVGDLPDTLRPAQARDLVRQRVAELVARVKDSEARLASSRQRVAQLAKNDAEMKGQLAAFDSTVASFRSMVENQKTQIASLTTQIDALQTENTTLKNVNTQLSTEKAQLSTEKASLTTERNTVYYVVGTREELLKSHLIEMTGGFLGFGKTPVPSRDLTAASFVAIDRTVVNHIDFPAPDRSYRIITRQDIGALEAGANGTELKGGLKIADHEKFWAASKYLIIVEN